MFTTWTEGHTLVLIVVALGCIVAGIVSWADRRRP